MAATDPITPSDFMATDGLEDWRVLGDGANVFYRTASVMQGARLVGAIGDLAGIDDHPPAIDVRAAGVTVRIITITSEMGGLTHADAELARGISEAARALGLVADPGAVQSFLVIPGAPDIAAVQPFWQAILDYAPRPDSPEEDLVDPLDRLPGFWLEAMDEPRADGGGAIHVAVWLPVEQAESRVAAALSAGGRLVRDHAPAWWTLADAAGNEADVATIAARD